MERRGKKKKTSADSAPPISALNSSWRRVVQTNDWPHPTVAGLLTLSLHMRAVRSQTDRAILARNWHGGGKKPKFQAEQGPFWSPFF
jgi:hypothetical protein